MHTLADTADLDNGPRANKAGTERMCFVSRRVQPIDDLIRFVVAPTGDVIPDLKRKLPGRGLWIEASAKAVGEAVRRKLFAKGFKKAVTVAPTLVEDTDRLMVRSVLDALAMTAKAGQIVSGFSKVQDAIRNGSAEALIHASDGAADGIRKINALALATFGPERPETAAPALAPQHAGHDSPAGSDTEQTVGEVVNGNSDDTSTAQSGDKRALHGLPVVTLLSSDELDLALGRSNVIHAAVLPGPASKSFLSRSQTLVRYRMAGGDNSGADISAVRSNKPSLATETAKTGSPATTSSSAPSEPTSPVSNRGPVE